MHTHLDNNQEALSRKDEDPDHVKSLESGNGKFITIGFPEDGANTIKFNTDEKQHVVVNDASLFPDGGLRAWSVVGASFLLVFCTFGASRHNKC